MRRPGSIVVLLVALSCPSFAQDSTGNKFENVTVGFEITKPDSWVFMTAEQNLENLKRVKFSDEEFQEEVVKYANAPLVAITKYAEPYDDLNPGIKVNVKPYGGLKGTEPVGLLDIMLPFVEKVVKDYELVQKPVAVEVAGIESAYARFDFTKKLSDSTSITTTSELWVVPDGDYFFLIDARTRQDQTNGTREEIEKIVKTVKISQE